MHSRAYSLIELLVVLGIVAILSGIAIPSYHNYLIKAQVIELLTIADSYKVKLIENMFTAAAVPHSVYNLDSSTIERVTVGASERNAGKHVIQVVAKMKTAQQQGIGLTQPSNASAPLQLELHGTQHGEIIEWTCHVAAEYHAYVPSKCHNNDLENVRVT